MSRFESQIDRLMYLYFSRMLSWLCLHVRRSGEWLITARVGYIRWVLSSCISDVGIISVVPPSVAYTPCAEKSGRRRLGTLDIQINGHIVRSVAARIVAALAVYIIESRHNVQSTRIVFVLHEQ